MKLRLPRHKVYLQRVEARLRLERTVDGWRWLGVQVRVVGRVRR